MPKPLACCCLALSLLIAHAQAATGVPKVALSEQHRAMCKVGVGDTLPAMTLATPNGDSQDLKPLLGKEATIVVFYRPPASKTGGWMTRSLLADLPEDVAKPYGESGVSVVAIAVDAKAEPIEGVLSLSDADGKALSMVGEGKLPRVYVVDAEGKILWLDIEYSNSTRRELRQTMVSIAGSPPVASSEP